MKILAIIIIAVIILWIFLIFKFTKKSWKLTSDQKDRIQKNYTYIMVNSDTKHKIIDFDKLYHKILLEIGYQWSFWEILKQNPVEISDINKIWELHKLRNKLVHDFDLLNDGVLRKKAKEYDKEISWLMKRI